MIIDSFDLLSFPIDWPDIFDLTPSGQDGIECPPDPEYYFRKWPEEIEAFLGLKLSFMFSLECFPIEFSLLWLF